MTTYRFDAVDIDGTLNVDGIATFQLTPVLVTGTLKASTTGFYVLDSAGTSRIQAHNHVVSGVANNGTGTVTSVPPYSTFWVSETSVVGNTAQFTVTGGAIVLTNQTGSDFSITPGTASSTNVTFSAG